MAAMGLTGFTDELIVSSATISFIDGFTPRQQLALIVPWCIFGVHIDRW